MTILLWSPYENGGSQRKKKKKKKKHGPLTTKKGRGRMDSYEVLTHLPREGENNE